MNAFDQGIMTFVQENFHNPITDGIFPFITYLGEAGIIWIAASLFFFCLPKTRRFGLLALIALLLTFLVGEIALKNLISRPRPFVDFPQATLLIAPPRGFSFPSGHSGSSFAAATVFFCMNKKIGLCALVLAGLIAFSRVFLFVHYPTDILAGAVLGVLVALATVCAFRSAEKNRTSIKRG